MQEETRHHGDPLTACCFLRVANPTVASIFSLVCGWKRVGSVEMYSVRRSHDTLTWWCLDLLASWGEEVTGWEEWVQRGSMSKQWLLCGKLRVIFPDAKVTDCCSPYKFIPWRGQSKGLWILPRHWHLGWELVTTKESMIRNKWFSSELNIL